jgi:tRNA (mo5U34)-methyltransferase
MEPMDSAERLADHRRRIAEHPLWYHSIEVEPGVVTPGWFDLRPVVDRLPWPDMRGRRCLDIGTYDGFLAFEMERRGASEVVAVDIADPDEWDWPARLRAQAGAELARLAGADKVKRREVSIYDLDPADLGAFDVVTCGSLLLHLRDPLRALEAVRRVTTGTFLSAETIDLSLSVRHPREAVARLNVVDELCQWWIPNVAGHRRMVESAGFDIIRTTKPYAIPYGAAHPPPRTARDRAQWAFRRTLLRAAGVPHVAVLARPAI